MVSLVFAAPLLPGKREAWIRFTQELLGQRRASYATTCREAGVWQEQFWLVPGPRRLITVILAEINEPAAWHQRLKYPHRPTGRWFRRQIQELHGIDPAQQQKVQPELIAAWRMPDHGSCQRQESILIKKKECDMSNDRNKQIIRHFYTEAFEKGNLDVLDELLTDDFVAHAPAEPGHDAETQDASRLKEEIARNRAAFPDLSFTIQEMIAEGDKVAIRWTAEGTHKGKLMDMPPTGKEITLNGMNFLHLRDGKIAEDWVIWDSMGMMQQLGMGPGSESGG